MSDADPGMASVATPAASHAQQPDLHDDSGQGHGHGHEEVAEPLGPPDLVAWAYAVVGGAIGLVVALALYVAEHA